MTAPPARPHLLPRPSAHFGLRKSASSSMTGEWGWGEDTEDDAWDSTSDHEDSGVRSRQPLVTARGGRSGVSSASRTPSSSITALPTVSPIPFNGRRSPITSPHTMLDQARSSSSGGGPLSFSYTHVDVPSPSSYPTKAPIPQDILTSHPDTLPPQLERKGTTGWTIVRTEPLRNEGVPVEGAVIHGEQSVEQPSQGDAESKGAEPDTDVDGDMVLGEMEFDGDQLPSSNRTRVGKAAIRRDTEEIVKDPLSCIQTAVKTKAATTPTTAKQPESSHMFLNRTKSVQAKEKRDRKLEKCQDILLKDDIDINALRTLSWSGVPPSVRHVVWPILLGYLPLSSAARLSVLQRKREEYASLVDLTFSRGKDSLDQQIWHQIEIDVPRTRPGVRLWMERGTQRSLEKILYVWAIRHPASGYVQGINDLVTPFYQVFLSTYIDVDPEEFDPAVLPPHILNAIEADSFWCLSRLLDGIQDNYIHSQPGIQRSVKRMRELVSRIDPPLAAHLDAQGVEFMQFAFRWMNCLLMREISVKNTIRMWDTYLSESKDAFSQFHLYVCSAFLVHWSEKLREMDFQGIIMFLQSLPTQTWTDHEIELLLSEAFVLNSTWANAQSHFSATG